MPALLAALLCSDALGPATVAWLKDIPDNFRTDKSCIFFKCTLLHQVPLCRSSWHTVAPLQGRYGYLWNQSGVRSTKCNSSHQITRLTGVPASAPPSSCPVGSVSSRAAVRRRAWEELLASCALPVAVTLVLQHQPMEGHKRSQPVLSMPMLTNLLELPHFQRQRICQAVPMVRGKPTAEGQKSMHLALGHVCKLLRCVCHKCFVTSWPGRVVKITRGQSIALCMSMAWMVQSSYQLRGD